MNLVEYYNISLAVEIVNFREKMGLTLNWIQSARVFYISIYNENNVSDDAYALRLGIDVATYRGLLIKYGGEKGANDNINFNTEEEAQKARDAIAFYVIIERRLRNESNRDICPK